MIKTVAIGKAIGIEFVGIVMDYFDIKLIREDIIDLVINMWEVFDRQ
jgi:hypothetical protein